MENDHQKMFEKACAEFGLKVEVVEGKDQFNDNCKFLSVYVGVPYRVKLCEIKKRSNGEFKKY
jgi:hypothetical protein